MDDDLILLALKSLKKIQLEQIKNWDNGFECLQAVILHERLVVLIHKLTYTEDK